MKFVRRTAKYTWHDYQPMKAFYQNLKLTQMLRKVKITEINGYNVFGEWTETNRQTATLNYEKRTMWETKPRTTPQKTSRLLMEPEQVTRSKTLQAI